MIVRLRKLSPKWFEHERVDIAIHAAGVSRDAVVWKLSVDDWDKVQAVNLRGAFLLIRHVLPSCGKSRMAGVSC